MTVQLLKRRPHHRHAGLPLVGDLALTKARLHECCGRARQVFALMLAAQTTGPVFWIAPSWMPDQLNPDGMVGLVDPGRFLFVRPQRPEDILWTLEEVLRSGTVALAVADIPGLPGLTPVRRLHLAAETGAKEGEHSPLGLLLTPGDGGAQGVESRWRLDPAHEPNRSGWHLRRLRSRDAPVADWTLHGKEGRFLTTPAFPLNHERRAGPVD